MEENLITEDQGCTTYGYQSATVCVPVTVTAKATAGNSFTKCCGEAVVTPGNNCPGEAKATCQFTMSQDICVAIPITFSAKAEAGDANVACGGAGSTPCPDCGDDEDAVK